MDKLSENYSIKVFWQLIFALIISVGLIFYGFASLSLIYLEEQLTHTGFIINGLIVLLFLIGIAKVLWILRRYSAEESAIKRFSVAIHQRDFQPDDGISTKHLIIKRYQIMQSMHKQHAEIDQGALASLLVAYESTRISFPRFIHNILILSGVFGTIVSLSMALVGASSLLNDTGEFSHMGTIIHGMSTALSTTITAIVCYVFYGYFFLRLTDVQTRILGKVEEVTTVFLLPRFNHTGESIINQVGDLVQALKHVAISIQTSQHEYTQAGSQLQKTVEHFNAQMEPVGQNIHDIKWLLQQGFRLPEIGDSQNKKG